MKYVPWLVVYFFSLVCLYGTASRDDPKALFYFGVLVLLGVFVPTTKVKDVSS